MMELEEPTITLQHVQFGDPKEVIDLIHETKKFALKEDKILVKVLGASINPADLITIRGIYSIKPSLPAIPGNECLARVIAVGPAVQKLKVGDLITPFKRGIGTWRSHIELNESDAILLPKDIGIAEGATINVNPCTAYRMLKDFVELKPGDTVIQNGANSSCGQVIIQLCKIWGVNCVGVVRDRPGVQKLRQYLLGLGASKILTDTELKDSKIFDECLLPRPVLAINCVGGDIANNMIKHMADNSTFVTYGNMSGQPISIQAGEFIYKNISFKGYWMTRWTKENTNNPERLSMFNEIIKYVSEKKLKAPEHVLMDINTINYKHILEEATKSGGFIGKKYIMVFSQ